MADTGFHFPLAIRILDAAWHGDRLVVSEHVAIQWIDRWIVDVGL